MVRHQRATVSSRKNQGLGRPINRVRVMSLQCLYDRMRERNLPPARTGFRRTELPHKTGFRNYQRLSDEVYTLPSQRQDFTDPRPVMAASKTMVRVGSLQELTLMAWTAPT